MIAARQTSSAAQKVRAKTETPEATALPPIPRLCARTPRDLRVRST
jgi:hypothetical protein